MQKGEPQGKSSEVRCPVCRALVVKRVSSRKLLGIHLAGLLTNLGV